ncbi:MAG: GTPase Era [Christensenellales bacterium]
MPFRSGFITVVGKPNVGKSTLVNRLVGEKIAIVSPKPQTTRNSIIGVVTNQQERWQMVFVDTPGIHTPRTRLGDSMEKSIYDALQGMDILIIMLDATNVGKPDRAIVDTMKNRKQPKFLLINKVDLVHPQQLLPMIASFADDGFDSIIPISARTGEGLDALKTVIISHLPQGPMYYPDDMWTDQTERQICAELIREKALLNLREEIPHGVGVEVLAIENAREGLVDIHANIYCERDNHKPIIIGKGGAMLSRIGSQARSEIELLLGTQVNLQLWVKVRPGWRDNLNDLRTLGYTT